MKQYVFMILLTAALTFVLTWIVWKVSVRFKLYPGIRDRDMHTTPIPRLGGIAIFLGIAIAILASPLTRFATLWADPAPILSVLVASFLIVLVGVADDLWDLDWFIKLAAQFLAAGIVAVWGGLQIYTLPIGGLVVGSSWMSIALTMLAIVVVMNAVNFIDGLDGLVAGVVLIANVVFFAYAYMLLRDTGATSYFALASFLAALMIGACIGFLPLNFNPAKIFMGDAGALLFGLLMACSAVAITGHLDPATLFPDGDENFGKSQLLAAFIPILLPVLILILPLADFGLAVLRRTSAGKSPFSPDRKHLHHRMIDAGHAHRATVLVFYSWTAVISLSVLIMYIGTTKRWPGTYLWGIAYLVLGVIACAIVTFLPATRRARRVATPETPVPLTKEPLAP